MTLFDLLHESKLFYTGAEVRRYIHMQGAVELVTELTIKNPDYAVVPGRKYRIYVKCSGTPENPEASRYSTDLIAH